MPGEAAIIGEGSPDEIARAVIDANLYMVLATADRDGTPWASPVYYAPSGYREFLWVSKPESIHSRNIEVRPEVSVVIFDSTVAIGTGQGVYVSALAGEVPPDGRAAAIETFSRRGVAHGGGEWRVDDVVAPARHRLYRATATARYILDRRDNRVPVSP